MIELLGHIPKNLALSGRYSSEFFTKSGLELYYYY